MRPDSSLVASRLRLSLFQAGVTEVKVQGVGSVRVQPLYHPMPNPSPLRLPYPRWKGRLESLRRSRAS
jgi:hypothetical protein